MQISFNQRGDDRWNKKRYEDKGFEFQGNFRKYR